jgi:hypothetical protein
MQTPLRYKILRPVPEVLEPFQVYCLPKIEPLPKFIVIQAHQLNTGYVYLSDTDKGFDVKADGSGFESLAPGEKKIIEIDQNRAVGLDLSSIFYMGTIKADRLVVSYLEEQQNG